MLYVSFKYLGSFLLKDEGVDRDNLHSIQIGRLKWRTASDILCDYNLPLMLKEKFCKRAITLVVLYKVVRTNLKQMRICKDEDVRIYEE